MLALQITFFDYQLHNSNKHNLYIGNLQYPEVLFLQVMFVYPNLLFYRDILSYQKIGF